MKLKEAFDKAKEKLGEIVDGLLNPQPEPQLVPIPVRSRPGYKIPAPKERSPWG